MLFRESVTLPHTRNCSLTQLPPLWLKCVSYICNTKYVWTVKSSLISCVFKAAVTLLVICYWELLAFQSAPKCETENRLLLLHVLTGTIQTLTQVPSSTSITAQNKFSQFSQSSYGSSHFFFVTLFLCTGNVTNGCIFRIISFCSYLSRIQRGLRT